MDPSWDGIGEGHNASQIVPLSQTVELSVSIQISFKGGGGDRCTILSPSILKDYF